MTSPHQPLGAQEYSSDLEMMVEDVGMTLEKSTSTQEGQVTKEAAPMASLFTDVAIDPTELDRLRKVNPLAAFDLLMKNNALFSDSCGKSSNVSADTPSENLQENLLAEFRTKVLKADLVEVVEQSNDYVAEVKELLRKLGDLPSGSIFRDFAQTFVPLLDDLSRCLQQKKSNQAQIEEQTQLRNKILEDISAFQRKFELFKQRAPTTQREIEDINASIAEHEAEIQRLTARKTELLSQEKILQQEAIVVLQKADQSALLQQQIKTLADNNPNFDAMVSELKLQLDKLTSEFVI